MRSVLVLSLLILGISGRVMIVHDDHIEEQHPSRENEDEIRDKKMIMRAFLVQELSQVLKDESIIKQLQIEPEDVPDTSIEKSEDKEDELIKSVHLPAEEEDSKKEKKIILEKHEGDPHDSKMVRPGALEAAKQEAAARNRARIIRQNKLNQIKNTKISHKIFEIKKNMDSNEEKEDSNEESKVNVKENKNSLEETNDSSEENKDSVDENKKSAEENKDSLDGNKITVVKQKVSVAEKKVPTNEKIPIKSSKVSVLKNISPNVEDEVLIEKKDSTSIEKTVHAEENNISIDNNDNSDEERKDKEVEKLKQKISGKDDKEVDVHKEIKETMIDDNKDNAKESHSDDSYRNESDSNESDSDDSYIDHSDNDAD